MRNINTLSQKTKQIIPEESNMNFPSKFKHMTNINIEINTEPLRLKLVYDGRYDSHSKTFKIRTIDEDNNIIIYPHQLTDIVQIKLLEENGPFIVKR